MKLHSKEAKLPKVSLVPLALLVGAVLFAQLPLCAQQTATTIQAEPEFKAIWEPANYPEDLQLTSVFFVTPDVGWVTGSAGTILHTRDGGASWEVQLGGDPQSGGKTIEGLRFVDETHGWAFQGGWAGRLGSMLLRTTDGENWEEVGPLGEYVGWKDYHFTSEAEGVLLALGSQQDAGKDIWRTQDSGRHWQQVFTCQTKTQVGGLTRDVGCSLMGLHFPSPLIGYAIGANRGITDRIFVAKTEDGGATWNVRLVPGPEVGDSFSALDLQAFFVDENTGFICLKKGGKVYATTDGGENWLRLIAAPKAGRSIKFADPEVGWSFNRSSLVYTIDGGKRWISRPIAFPVEPTAFSFPRRDRGYVVGDHGMIYRYSIVPADYEMPGMVDAPMMPGIDSLLDDQLEQLDEQFEALEVSLRVASETEEYPPAAVAEGEEAQWEEGEEMGWVEDCCGEQLQPFETTLDTLAAEIPVFTGKYRNLNLVSVGLSLIGQLFGQTQGLKDSFAAFKYARDPQSALAALAEVSAQLDYLRETTTAAFQKPALTEPSESEPE